MKRDMMVLIAVLLGVLFFIFFSFGLGSKKYTKTVWIEKQSGDGPYKMNSGSRSAEEGGINIDDKDPALPFAKKKKSLELHINKTTSEYEVRLSSEKGALDDIIFNESESIPSVSY